MTLRPLIEHHHLEFLSLEGGCTGVSEYTLVKKHIVRYPMSQLICQHTIFFYGGGGGY